jgi:transcriptional regulator with XRE-family HTH domain
MSAPKTRIYSRYTIEALSIMGDMIKLARRERRLTQEDLADRSNLSLGLIKRIEKGDSKCQIGAAFEVATILGVRLFHEEHSSLAVSSERIKDKLALLPKKVRKDKRRAVDDDF